jgi:hypothetical protein
MGKNFHVVKHDEGWAIKKEGVKTPLSEHRTQELARQNAVLLAKHDHSEVVIHGTDGKIRDKDSYGNDPFPPRDKNH